MKLLAIDIETTPNVVYTWGLYDQNVGENQIVSTTEILCFAAKWLGDKHTGPRSITFASVRDGRGVMLDDLWRLLDEADAVVHWNGVSFDMRHIAREFLVHGYDPPSPTMQLDLMQAVKRRFKFQSNRLDHVAQQLGIGRKVKHEGFDLWRKCLAGEPGAWLRMEKYNRQDVQLLDGMYRKLLPWLPSHPNGQQVDGHTGCPRCGAPASAIRSHGLRHTAAQTYRRYRCGKCASWFRSAAVVKQRTKSTMRDIP